MAFPKTTMANPGRSIIDLSVGVSRGGSNNGKDGLTDMKNMRADKYGLYVRAGSKNMLPVYNEWAGHYRLGDLGFEKVTISESRLMLGVDADGKLWALSERFPQVKFAVWSRIRSTEAAQIVLPTIHGESSSRYFGIEMEQFYFIVDERMNSLRIDKRGKVEWWYDPGYKQNVATATADFGIPYGRYQYPVVAEKSGYGPSPSDARVYLDCSIATNTKPQTFSVLENREGNVVPIRGVVRFANVNDCNVIGEWSDETVITDWLDAYYSRHPGVALLAYEGVAWNDGTLKKFIDLKEEEPVFATPTDRSPLYLGYADGATQPSLSTSFIGTPVVDSMLFLLYFDYTVEKWVCNISVASGSIANWENDMHRTINTQQLVATQDPNGYKGSAIISVDDLILEVEKYIPIQHESSIISNPVSGSTSYDDKHVFWADDDSAWGFYIKESAQLRELRLKYQSAPTLWVQKPSGIISPPYNDYEVSHIVLFGAIQRHVNRTFRLPFATTTALSEYKHLGFDTWTRKDYTPNYAAWTYDNDLDLIAIEPDKTGDVILDRAGIDELLEQRFAVQENGKTTLVSSKIWTDSAGAPLYQSSVGSWPTGRVLLLKACPIMTPQYRKLRNILGYEIREFAKTARSCTSKPAYNNGKLFFIDGGNLIMSDQTLLDLGKVKGIVGTPRAVVSFADGCLCFTDRGVHLVDGEGKQRPVDEGEPSSKAIFAKGGAVSISDRGNILLYAPQYDRENRINVVVTSLSSNIPDIVFGNDACLAIVGSIIYASTKNEVWGFDLDNPGWKAGDKYDTNIAAIGEFNDNLVVLFNAEPNVELTFTPVVGEMS